jgi:hypothetical protein
MNDEERDELLREVLKSSSRAAANSGAAVEQGRDTAKRVTAVEGRLDKFEKRIEERVSTLEGEMVAGVHLSNPSLLDEDELIPVDHANVETETPQMVEATSAPEAANADGLPPPMRKPAPSITTEVQKTRASVRAVAINQARAIEKQNVVIAQNEQQTTMLAGLVDGAAASANASPIKKSIPYTIGTAVGGFIMVVALQAFNTALQSCASSHMTISGHQVTTMPAPILPLPSIAPSSSAPPASVAPPAKK